MRMRWRGQPQVRASCWRLAWTWADSGWRWTCWGWDWRTETMAQRSKWCPVILAGRWLARGSGVVIAHLRSAGSGVADVSEQQGGQLDQQVGLQLGRQLVPARNRAGERRAGPGRGGTPVSSPYDDIGDVPPWSR